MIEFLRIQYRLGRINEMNLDKLVNERTIIEEDKNYIIG